MIDKTSRILIVDHFKMMRATLRQLLNDLGYRRVEESSNAQEAEEFLMKARQEGDPYTLVFLDWNLPEENSRDFIQFCRRSEDFRALAILVVSGEADQAQVFQALSTGATDYMVKPFHAETLRNKMARLRLK